MRHLTFKLILTDGETVYCQDRLIATTLPNTDISKEIIYLAEVMSKQIAEDWKYKHEALGRG